MIKLAQIGYGTWGPNLTKAFSRVKNAQLSILADNSNHQLSLAQVEHPGLELISDWHSILESDIDAVIIATPAFTHYRMAKELLKAGKHVFVEKPMTTSFLEAQELHHLAEANHLVLMIGHIFLYHPAINFLKKEIDSVGKIYSLFFKRHNLGHYKYDVNAWWNFAPHDLSIALFLMNGILPSSISVKGKGFINSAREDFALAYLEWSNDIVCQISVSWLFPTKEREITLIGSKKMITFNDLDKSKILVHDCGIQMDSSGKAVHIRGETIYPKIDSEEPLLIEAQNFIDSILRESNCKSNSTIGMDVIKLLQAGSLSMQNNGEKIDLTNYIYQNTPC